MQQLILARNRRNGSLPQNPHVLSRHFASFVSIKDRVLDLEADLQALRFALDVAEVEEDFLVVRNGFDEAEAVLESGNVALLSRSFALVFSLGGASGKGGRGRSSGCAGMLAFDDFDVDSARLLGRLELVDVEPNDVAFMRESRQSAA